MYLTMGDCFSPPDFVYSGMILSRQTSISRAVIVLAAIAASCTYNDFPNPVDCTTSDLSVRVDAKQDPTLCNSIDGSITVSGSGGEAPYTYKINDDAFQSSNSFQHLGPGSYTITIKDSHGCENSSQVEISSPTSTLNATVTVTTDTECFSDNGSITVAATEGKPPYTYQFENGSFGSVSTFTGLKFGNYTVTVKDADGCPKLLNVTVPRGISGLSYANDIAPILSTKCNVSGCHNGDLGSSRDWRNYNNVKSNAGNIKTRTGNRSMPVGGLSLNQDQIDKIACWVDDGAPNN